MVRLEVHNIFGRGQLNVGPRRHLPEPEAPPPAVINHVNHLLAVGRDHGVRGLAVEGQLCDPHLLKRRGLRRAGPIIFVQSETRSDDDRHAYQGE